LYKSLEKHLDAIATDADAIAPAVNTKLNEEIKIEPVDQPTFRPVESSTPNESAANEEDIPKPPEVAAVAMPKISSDPILKEFGESISSAARTYKVDPKLVYSVIKAESDGRANAVSPQGAKGLMQLIDSTATAMGVSDSLDPHQNIHGGTKYLRQLLDRFDGDVKLAVAAYNAGPGAVSKYDGVPPYPETRRYVEKVLTGLHSGPVPMGR
jgi:soluble lytic murein transglycosylase-like protein